jgi:hypothetical protein
MKKSLIAFHEGYPHTSLSILMASISGEINKSNVPLAN